MEHKKQSPARPVPQEDRQDESRRAERRRDGIQGEGNYESSRAFNDAERKFVESGKGPARPEAPRSEEEKRELIEAEEAAKRRAKK